MTAAAWSGGLVDSHVAYGIEHGAISALSVHKHLRAPHAAPLRRARTPG